MMLASTPVAGHALLFRQRPGRIIASAPFNVGKARITDEPEPLLPGFVFASFRVFTVTHFAVCGARRLGALAPRLPRHLLLLHEALDTVIMSRTDPDILQYRNAGEKTLASAHRATGNRARHRRLRPNSSKAQRAAGSRRQSRPRQISIAARGETVIIRHGGRAADRAARNARGNVP
jgi:hypothetical protein